VRRSTEKYDAIISVHTISNAAIASGALGLAENYVLTREAFEDYLDHLAPDGMIFFTRPEHQIPRLFATAREAFTLRGMGPIANHVLGFSMVEKRQLPGRLSFSAGFLLKKSAFRPEELVEIRRILTAEAGSGEDANVLKILYAPDERYSDSLYAHIVEAPDLESVFQSTDTQLAAATDDKPFFNQHTRWSRIRWNTIVDLFSQKQPFGARLALEDRPIAEVTLLILLLQSAVVAGVCILLPLVSDCNCLVANRAPWFCPRDAFSPRVAGSNAAFFRFGSMGVGRQWILYCDWHGAGADAWNDGWFPNGAVPRVWLLPRWAARDKKDFRQD